MVFLGVDGAPADRCGVDMKTGTAFTSVPKTPVVSEKPYITIDASGKYSLEVPPLKTDSSSANFDTTGTTSVGFDKVYVASVGDTAAAINKKLAAGLHVVARRTEHLPGQKDTTSGSKVGSQRPPEVAPAVVRSRFPSSLRVATTTERGESFVLSM